MFTTPASNVDVAIASITCGLKSAVSLELHVRTYSVATFLEVLGCLHVCKRAPMTIEWLLLES